MMQINLPEAQNYVSNVVLEAGKIHRRYFGSRNLRSRQKDGMEFSTRCDDEADKFLIGRIRRRYPNTEFLTEETAPEDYSALKGAEYLWVIDPLDGTTNFSRGHNNFAISVALVYRSKPVVGVVYVPMSNDMYLTNDKTKRSYHNGRVMRVSRTKDLKKAVIACDWSWNLDKRKEMLKWLEKIIPNVRAIKSMGSIVADLTSLGDRKIDAYVYPGVKPWDVAASSLLVENAGGKITTPEDREWNIFEPDIIATNGILHYGILKLLRQ